MDQRDVAGAMVACDSGAEPGDAIAHDTGIDVIERSIADVVHDLHDGRLSPQGMSAELRRRCVEHLTSEGFSLAEIAELMRVCERTIGRDRAAIRSEGAIEPSLRLGGELMGELERITLSAIQRLRRLGGDSKTPAFARLWATEATVRVYERFVDKARAMHYCIDGSAVLNYLATTDKERNKHKAELETIQRDKSRKEMQAFLRGPLG